MRKTGAVKFNIPSGNQTETSTISGFKGLQLTDNPLTADSMSSSDMLNVYLTMENTLSTRPRLEYRNRLNCDEVITECVLDDENILYQIKIENDIKLSLNGNVDIDLQSYVVGESKIFAFKKDDKIYILSSTGYYVIKSDNKLYSVVNDEDTYIPIASIFKDNVEISNEDLNIYSKYYKKLIYWDGKTPVNKYGINGKLDYNKYYEYKPLASEENLYITAQSKVNKYILTNSDRTKFYFYKDNSLIDITSKYNIPNNSFIKLNDEGLYLLYRAPASDNLVLINLNNDVSVTLTMTTFTEYTSERQMNDMFISFDGETIIAQYSYATEDGRDEHIDKFVKQGSIIGYVLINHKQVSRRLQREYRNDYYQLDKSSGADNIYSSDGSFWLVYNNTVSIYDSFVQDPPSGMYNVIRKDNYLVLINDEELYRYKYDDASLAFKRLNRYDLSVDCKPYTIYLDDVFAITKKRYLIEYNITDNGLNYIKDNNLYYLDFETGKSFKIAEFDKEVKSIVNGTVICDGEDLGYYEYSPSTEPLLSYIYENEDYKEPELGFDYYTNFYNNYWLVSGNTLYNTTYNNPTYITANSESVIGDDSDITGITLLSDTSMCVYKANKQYVIYASISDGVVAYHITEMRGEEGNIPKFQTLNTNIDQYPLQFNNHGIFVLRIPENVNTDTNTAVSVSSNIDKRFLAETDKDKIITHSHLYWTYVIFPGETSKIYVLDNRTYEWYYWEVPVNVIGCRDVIHTYDIVKNSDDETIRILNHDKDWSFSIVDMDENGNPINEEIYSRDNQSDYEQRQYTDTEIITKEGYIYDFKTIDYFDSETDLGTRYFDEIKLGSEGDLTDAVVIPWKWESQIMSLTYSRYNKNYSAIGYSKQLYQTGFTFVDTDRTEEYSLNYKFIVYRKHMSEKTSKELPIGTLNYIRSVIKRTRVPKFNFIKIILTNNEENDKNRLNLISLKLKYKLMEETING